MLARFGHIEAIPDDWRDVARERRQLRRARANAGAATANRALLFRTLATLRTDIPLFGAVEELRWTGPSPEFAALAARFDASVTGPDWRKR